MEKLRTYATLLMLFTIAVIAVPLSGVQAQDTFIWSADVPSSGASVTSPMLEAGREYRIVARGVFQSFPPPFKYYADAQYYTTGSWDTSFVQPDNHSFLQINGLDVVWGMWNNTPYYHTYEIYRLGSGAPLNFRIVDWVDGNYTNNDCHLHVKLYEGPLVPPEGETAYAYGGDYATCFLSLGFRKWGWTNGPLEPGYYEFDIYAGAARCNINKGTRVGTLTILYNVTATITYILDEGYEMDFTHLYVGSELLPRDNFGEYTVSPGAYPYQHYWPEGATIDSYSVPGLSGPIYVVAHADVYEA